MNNNRDQRTGWLAALKQGDEVGILSPAHSAHDRATYYLATAARISPSGRITTSSYVFDPDGSVRGLSPSAPRLRLAPAAEAHAALDHEAALGKARTRSYELDELLRGRAARRLTTEAARDLATQIEALTEAAREKIGGAS